MQKLGWMQFESQPASLVLVFRIDNGECAMAQSMAIQKLFVFVVLSWILISIHFLLEVFHVALNI